MGVAPVNRAGKSVHAEGALQAFQKEHERAWIISSATELLWANDLPSVSQFPYL